MNSYLITGGNLQDRLENINLQLASYSLQLDRSHPDLLLIQPNPSVRISHIRKAIQFLSRKPYQASIKSIVIGEAEKMTIPAQNAFLKTLEEPPADSLIFLCSPNEELLLPTVVSRCQIIKVANGNNLTIANTILNTKYQILNTLLQARVGERLKLIEPYEKSREEAIKFCEEMILVLRNNLINKNQSASWRINNQPFDYTQGKQLTIIIKSFQSYLDLLKANVNVKLVLDNLVINL